MASFIRYFFILIADQVLISMIGVLPSRVLHKVDASCNIFVVVALILEYWILYIIVCILYCLIWINIGAHKNQQILCVVGELRRIFQFMFEIMCLLFIHKVLFFSLYRYSCQQMHLFVICDCLYV
jgi:hypothetical protein